MLGAEDRAFVAGSEQVGESSAVVYVNMGENDRFYGCDGNLKEQRNFRPHLRRFLPPVSSRSRREWMPRD